MALVLRRRRLLHSPVEVRLELRLSVHFLARHPSTPSAIPWYAAPVVHRLDWMREGLGGSRCHTEAPDIPLVSTSSPKSRPAPCAHERRPYLVAPPVFRVPPVLSIQFPNL